MSLDSNTDKTCIFFVFGNCVPPVSPEAAAMMLIFFGACVSSCPYEFHGAGPEMAVTARIAQYHGELYASLPLVSHICKTGSFNRP